jgi:protein involved in polysaccharide export with SLBB domain
MNQTIIALYQRNEREYLMKNYSNPRLLIFLLGLSLCRMSGVYAAGELPDQAPATPPQQSAMPAIKLIQPFSPGNALSITVYPDTASFLNGIYRIDDNGYTDLPIIGLVQVTSQEPAALEKLLAQKYIDYLARPNIQVRPLIRVALQGGFRNPGLFWADPRENLWSLVARGGGTLREDGIKKIHWERDSGIVSKKIVADFQSGLSLTALGFRSGDQLWVTSRPKQVFWDVFRADVLPVLSIILSATSTAATAYFSYQAYNNRIR